MKEVFEKIIERLDKKRKYYGDNALSIFVTDGYTVAGVTNDAKEDAYVDAIEIVNQVAEEFGTDINVGSNDGWIPCSDSEIPNKSLDSLHEKILKSNFAEEVTEEELYALVKAKIRQAYKPKGE